MQGVSAAELPRLQAQELSVFYNLLFAPRRHYLYRTGQWENLLLTDKMEQDPLCLLRLSALSPSSELWLSQKLSGPLPLNMQKARDPGKTVSQHWMIFHLSQIYKRDT